MRWGLLVCGICPSGCFTESLESVRKLVGLFKNNGIISQQYCFSSKWFCYLNIKLVIVFEAVRCRLLNIHDS